MIKELFTVTCPNCGSEEIEVIFEEDHLLCEECGQIFTAE